MVRASGCRVGIAPLGPGGLSGWAHGLPRHSVTHVFLLHDLVSARTWLAAGNVLAGWVTGSASLLVIVIGVSVGNGRCQPRWSACSASAASCGAMSTSRVSSARPGLMLDARLSGWPAQARAGYHWGIVPRWRTCPLYVRAQGGPGSRRVGRTTWRQVLLPAQTGPGREPALGVSGVGAPRVQFVSWAGSRLHPSLRGCPRLAARGGMGRCACGLPPPPTDGRPRWRSTRPGQRPVPLAQRGPR